MKPSHNIPRLRFPEFSDAWEEKRLGDVATKCVLKNHNLKERRVLTNSASDGVIEQKEFFEKDIATEDNINGYYLSEKDDFIYNPRISKFAPVGPINRNEIGSGLFSPLYVVFRFKNVDTDFFKQFFKSSMWHDYILSVANYGVRHDRINITNAALMAMPLHSPHPDEQKKIAGFLGAVDRRIAALEARHASLAAYKKGLMQQLFSQTLRFTNPNNTPYPNWQEKRLGDVAIIVGGGTPDSHKKAFWGGDIQWFTPSEIKSKYLHESERTLTEEGLASSSAIVMPAGALLFCSRATIGDVAISTQECATNQGFQSLVIKSPHHIEFWYYWISGNRNEFLKHANGSTFKEISKHDVQKIEAQTPHPNEQKQIADFLSAIDRQKAALTQQITQSKAFKKALLQQMFV